MKYIVTGGAGFIGSNLVDELVSRGHEVRVIDNLESGLRENLNPRAEFVQADIRDLPALQANFQGFDGVFHCAALPRIPRSIQDPKGTHEVNVLGTLNVLLAARDVGVKRVVYSASASAYGNQDVLPVHEGMQAKPLNPYGLQKFIGEEYARIFSLLFGLETVSLRYFNVFGPRMLLDGAYATVIGIFMRQRKNGEMLTVCGDGLQTRDFTHAFDVARANIASMESPNVGKGEIINIGDGNQVSVNTVAKLVGGDVAYIPARPGEILHIRADINRAHVLIGWQPSVNFEDGLNELLAMHGLSKPGKLTGRSQSTLVSQQHI